MAGFAITIKAVDQVSGVITKINDKLTKQQNQFARRFDVLKAPVQRLTQAFKGFSDASGITRLGQAFTPLRAGIDRVAAGAKAAVGSLTGLFAPLAAITGAASVAGIASLITHWAEFGRALTNTAAGLGTTTGRLQSFQLIGGQLGVSAEAMAGGIRTLGTTMQDALMGRAPAASRLLQKLGIDFKSATYQAKTGAEKMAEVRDRISDIRDPLQQAAIATELFGGSAEAMMPYLRASRQRIAELAAEAKRYQLTMAETEGADEFARQQYLLTQSVQHFLLVLSSRLAPVLEPIIKRVRQFIDAWTTPENMAKVVDYIKQAAIRVKELGEKLLAGIEHIGGWGNALKVVIGIGLAAWIAPIIPALVSLTSAFVAVGVAMAANPVGATILAFAGLAAVVYLVARNWDWFKDKIAEIWANIKGTFWAGIDDIKEKLTWLGDVAVSGLMKAWTPLVKFFKDLWDDLTDLFDRGWKKIKPIIDGIKEGTTWLKNKLGMGSDSKGSGGTVSSNTLTGGNEDAPGWLGRIGRFLGIGGGGSGSAGPGATSTDAERAAAQPTQSWQVDDMKKLIAMGVSQNDAAGIIGNITAESAGNHKSQGDYKPGVGYQAFGLGQWHPPRQALFKEWYGKSIQDSTHDEQLRFYVDEARKRNQMPNAANPWAASRSLLYHFESPADRLPGGPNDVKRGITAENVNRAYNQQMGRTAPANTNLPPAQRPGVAANGGVQVDVNLNGAPPGTTATARATGPGVTATPPRVVAMGALM